MGKKILLIEDESDQVVCMKKRFEVSGYEFFYALSGQEGIKQAEAVKPDLILLDLRMREMGGLEVLRVLKSNKALKSIPVFILTAQSGKNIEEECKKAGASDIMFKPYDSKELLAKISSFFQKSP